jgi:hypothetical protein
MSTLSEKGRIPVDLQQFAIVVSETQFHASAMKSIACLTLSLFLLKKLFVI